MTLGKRIGQYRRKLGLTQEGLAQRLDVTNQAVSKWESDQCCPDIAQLPKLADLFGITMDELFGREAPAPQEIPLVEAEVAEEPEEPLYESVFREEPQRKTRGLFGQLFQTTMEKVNQAVELAEQKLRDSDITSEPGGREIPIPEEVVPDWEDDNTLRVAIFIGKRMVANHPARKRIEFCYDGPALNIHSECNVSCDGVGGNVSARGDISCDGVGGNASASGDISCDQVHGNVHAIGDVSCDIVLGHVKAGGDVNCDDVHGNVSAGGDVSCETVRGSVTAGGNVEIS